MANTVFYKNDYLDANSKVANHFDEVSNFLMNASNQIKAYYEGANGQLDSKAFTIIKNRLNMYSLLFSSFATSLKSYSQNIVKANNNVISSMGSYDELDSDTLEQLERSMNYALAYYQSLQSSESGKTNPGFSRVLSGAETNYYSKKREFEKYEALFDATMSADRTGLSSTDDLAVLISKMNSEIYNQGSIFE